MPSSHVLLASTSSATDWQGVGLLCAVVGGFLLSNAILFRHPKRLIEEYFAGRPRRLHSIRDYIFNRVQVHLGFVFLLAGFAFQLYAHYQPALPDPAPFPVVPLGLILVMAVGLEVVGWLWSKALFRKYVQQYLQRHPVDFESDTRLAREVGELFGVGSTPEDTVQSYVARLRSVMGLQAPGKAVAARPDFDADPDEL